MVMLAVKVLVVSFGVFHSAIRLQSRDYEAGVVNYFTVVLQSKRRRGLKEAMVLSSSPAAAARAATTLTTTRTQKPTTIQWRHNQQWK